MSESKMNQPQPEQGLSDEQVRKLLEGITPGEWEYYKGVSANEYHRGFQVTNHDLMIGYVHALSDTGRDDDGTGEANARLIAAAPQLVRDLLTARSLLAHLQAVMQRKEQGIEIERRWRTDAVAENARLTAALAEAEGVVKWLEAEADKDADGYIPGDFTTLAHLQAAGVKRHVAEVLAQALAKAQAQGQQGGE